MRESKLKNLVMFNVPEDPNFNNDDLLKMRSSEHDLLLVIDALSSCNIKTNVDCSKFYRIVKSFPRPIVIKMDERSDVVSIVTAKSKLSSQIKFSFDQTKLQRSEYKKLKKQADSLN